MVVTQRTGSATPRRLNRVPKPDDDGNRRRPLDDLGSRGRFSAHSASVADGPLAAHPGRRTENALTADRIALESTFADGLVEAVAGQSRHPSIRT